MPKNTFFQYCPKLVLFSADQKSIFLARRKGEADYDRTYSFIGGKSETTDESLVAALKREKDEEIGPTARVKVCPSMSCYQVLFRKKDGNAMIVPHVIAVFVTGDITLNKDEYDDYVWVPLEKLTDFEPKIPNIPNAVAAAERFLAVLSGADFSEI